MLRLRLGNNSIDLVYRLKQTVGLLVLVFAVIPLSYYKDNDESVRVEDCNYEAYDREYKYITNNRECRCKRSPDGCLSDDFCPETFHDGDKLTNDSTRTNILDVTDGDIKLISGNLIIKLIQYGTDGNEKFSDKMMVYYSSESHQKNPDHPKLTLDGSGIDLSDYNYYISIFSNCRQLEDYTTINYDSKKTFHLDGCLDYTPKIKIQPYSYPAIPSEDQLGLSDLIVRKGEAVTFRVSAVPDENLRIPKDMSIKVRLYLNSGEEYIDSESYCLNEDLPQDFLLTYRAKDYKEIYCIIPVIYAEKS